MISHLLMEFSKAKSVQWALLPRRRLPLPLSVPLRRRRNGEAVGANRGSGRRRNGEAVGAEMGKRWAPIEAAGGAEMGKR